jgi:hypothetical protein
MPAPVLHTGAVVMCSHAGPAQPLAPFARVLVSGQPVVTVASPWAITGCALSTTSTPPCVTGQMVVGAVRVLAGGMPVTTMASSSVAVPTGAPLIPTSAQPRVLAT